LRVRVYAGTDPVTGRRHYLSETVSAGANEQETLREAEKVRTRLINQIDERRNPRTRATMNELLDGWLDVVKLERTTRQGYVGSTRTSTRLADRHPDRHRHTAATRAAEAADTTDQARRAQLEQAPAETGALAGLLDSRVTELETVDEARALWWARTAGTRAAADRAAAELQARRAVDGRTDRDVTAAEILSDTQSDAQADDVTAQTAPRRLTRDTGRDHTTARNETKTRDRWSNALSFRPDLPPVRASSYSRGEAHLLCRGTSSAFLGVRAHPSTSNLV
jgi:hypothetical protein